MYVVYIDANSYQSKTPKKCLETADKEKWKNYLGACLKHHRHFNPFVISVEGLLRVESEGKIKRIARHLAMKWGKP